MALSSDQLEALIDWRIAQLRELAVWTEREFWLRQPRPTLAELVELARRERDVRPGGVKG